MGFRLRKSFKIAPGVRMTVSHRGVGYSVGGRGMRISRSAGGRLTGSVGIPGSGLSYSTRLDGGRPRRPSRPASRPQPKTAQPQQNKPGLFAPAPEKELYRALFEDRDRGRLPHIAGRHPDWAPLCAAFDGLLSYHGRDLAHAEAALRTALDHGGEIADHPFVRAYVDMPVITLRIAHGVDAALPPSREAVGLTLAELYQATGRPEQAIAVVEGLEPTFSAAVSLAELYSETGRHDAVIDLTNNLSNASDPHAFLLVMRARALAAGGMGDGAHQTLKEVLRRRGTDPEIVTLAGIEQARLALDRGERARARQILERLYARDAAFPGLADLLRQVESAD
ncbi:DUF4236 domain-containing protein [Thermobifida halotolerans]|uniref:DUF4236 domain-containing protein n=1 Tax=Thermobifida halotolerans TaxID=483545 RepID=A0AA97LXH3_9ACTN|nr:DUF4236 domain-containing protein [Thermobifida halotolerans]UOE19798.1 DUF4236 domain-containing protein [Thermobifida halotolerans]